MEKKRPRYRLKVDPNDDISGVEFISLVKDPAILMKGIAFNSQIVETKKFLFQTDKQIVLAPVAIPDLDIYRKDPEMGEYDVFYTSEDIEVMFDKFNRMVADHKVNMDHKTILKEAFIRSNWIVDTENKRKQLFADYDLDVPLGTWMAEIKIDNKAIWEEMVKAGGRTGFSFEGLFGLDKIMAERMKEYFDTINLPPCHKNCRCSIDNGVWVVTEIDEFPCEYCLENKAKFDAKQKYNKEMNKGQKFDDQFWELADGTPIQTESWIGNNTPVMLVADGSALPDGPYTLKESKTISVTIRSFVVKGGIITEYKEDNSYQTMQTKNNNYKMKKTEKIVFQFEDTLADGTNIKIDGDIAEGSMVSVVAPDGTTSQIEDGTHTLSDGTIIDTVAGKITKVTEPSAQAADVAAPATDAVSPQMNEEMVMKAVQPKFDEMMTLINEAMTKISDLEAKLAPAAEAMTSINEKFEKVIVKFTDKKEEKVIDLPKNEVPRFEFFETYRNSNKNIQN